VGGHPFDGSIFLVLDDKTPLYIYDTGITSALNDNPTSQEIRKPLDKLKTTAVIPANELDTHTIRVRNLMCSAMYQCFYSRYYPKVAYKNKVYQSEQKKDYHFYYLIDMLVMFHPALSNGHLLHHIIFSFEDVFSEEKERYFGLFMDFIWGTIASFAERVAYSIPAAVDCSDDDSPVVPKVRKAKIVCG
jgi:hypothetical protein